MEISYLKEFVVLAQTGNFMEAADILYSSQSTLSKHIKSIESELGISLFDRTTRKVKISKYGSLFLPYARKIVELQEKYAVNLKQNLETKNEVLNLGSIYGLAQYKITDILVAFKKCEVQATLNVMQASSRDLSDMLRQGRCELAFIRDVEDPDDEFVKIQYATDVVAAILPITHPLASHKTISLNKLADENFLLEVPTTMPYRVAIKACELSGFEPRVTITDIDRDYLIDLVSKGLGVSLMMKKLLLHFSNPQIAIVDVTPTVTTNIFLCYLKGITLSNAANQFLSCAGFKLP